MDEVMEPKDVAAFCKVSLQKAYDIMDHCTTINLSYTGKKKTRRVLRSELLRHLQERQQPEEEPERRRPGRPVGSKNRPTPMPVTRADGKCPRYAEVFGRKEA